MDLMIVHLTQKWFHASVSIKKDDFRMKYDNEFWNKYADENESRYNEEFSKYVRNLTTSLPGVQSILEIGCGTGIDLRLFPDSFQLHGIDLNEHALEIAREKVSNVNFQKGDIVKLPFEDSSIDFVFTHGLMNYLDDDILKKGISEMFRVSKRWIMHCEKYEKTEKQIDENHKFRNMGEKWLDYKIKFVSDVDLHEDYGQDQTRFTLLKKL